MASIRILARNVGDTATVTAVPAMSTTLPVTNLAKQTERARTARTTALASQAVKLAWTANQKVNCLGFTRHNWTTAATLRTQIYSDGAWVTQIYDGTALTAFSTSGLATDIDIYTESDFANLRSSMQYFASLTTMQSAIATIADGANPAGYIEQTRLWTGQYFEFSYNPPYGGVELTYMDKSIAGRADDGSHIVDKRWKARRLVVNLELVTDTDLPSVLAIARYLGQDKECFVSLYPGVGGVKELYNQMACRLVESPTFTPWMVGLHKSRLVFEET